MGLGVAPLCPSHWDKEGLQHNWEHLCHALASGIGKDPSGVRNGPAIPCTEELGRIPNPSGVGDGPTVPLPLGSGRIPMGLGMAPLYPSQWDWKGSQWGWE